jgi:hypothetical protein
MAQECNTLRSKTTFFWVQLEIYFPQFAQNHIQMLKVLYPTPAVDVEVNYEHLQKMLPKSLKTSDIVMVNVLVAFFNPNGMTV